MGPHYSEPRMRIGIDVGGTKIEGTAITEDGAELRRWRVATPRGDYRATLDAIASLVRQIEAEASQTGSVGLGIPGAPSPASGLIKNANSTWLNGQPFQADLAALLGREVRVANDANCFALSEAIDGAAAGAEVVFGVIIGTGTGAGVVVGGQVLTGPNAIAGEWGHNPLPWPEPSELPGPGCYCGLRGCIESFLSGPALAADFERCSGERLSADEIVSRAGRGDARAASALDRYENRMARALASIINVLDPNVIVLGGGMSKTDRLYENVPRLWDRYVFSAGGGRDAPRTTFVRARHGDSSGVRGAAWLWPAR
jgi:fructokinase